MDIRHTVVSARLGADGSLTGYAGGPRRKQELLALEEPAEVTASRLF
ncbi:hypothetical protein [Kitasatospora sp. NPDC101183]